MRDGSPKGSVQKDLIDRKRPLSSKYREMFIGRREFWPFLKFEVITLLFSRTPGSLGLFLRRLFYPCLFGKVGKGVVFGRDIVLRHPHKIRIGANTFLDDNVVLDAKGEANEGITIGENAYIGRNTILSCKEGSISLDDFCNISANCSLISETDIRIGKYCFLAGSCYLVAGGNHSFADISKPIMFQPSVTKGGIQIGEDCWLGAGTVVLDGVSIGKGSIVGAGSVVTASIPEYSLARGARQVKVWDRRGGPEPA